MNEISFDELIEKERELILTGDKYGEHFQNCLNFILLIQNFIKEAKPEAWVFAIFLSQIRKHIVLSFFSTLRLHHIQAMLVLRQVFEAGSKAAYAIAFPDEKKFVQTDFQGVAYEPKTITKEVYDWLEKNYPEGSMPLKRLKNLINESCAHSNAIYAMQNFKLGNITKKFQFSFFDEENPKLVKGNLWFIGNAAMGLMDLFYGVNKNRNLIIFTDDFVKLLKQYEAVGNRLKTEILPLLNAKC